MSLGDIISGGIKGLISGGGNPIAGALGAVGGVLSAREARKSEKNAASAASAAAQSADPFGPYRSAFLPQLMGLYGIKPDFAFSKQSELDKLTQQAEAAKKGSSVRSVRNLKTRPGSVKRGGQQDIQANGVSSDLQAQIDALNAQRASEEAAYKSAPAQSPTSFLEQLPGYKAALEAGQQGIIRGAAAQGSSLSGNLLTELSQYSADMASKTYGSEVDRLMTLTGATGGSSAAAGQISYNAATMPTTSKYAGVGELISAVSPYLTQKSGTNLITPTVQNTGQYIYPNG